MFRIRPLQLIVLHIVFVAPPEPVCRQARADGMGSIRFEEKPGRVLIFQGDAQVATYVYADPKTPRPYLTALRTPSGTAVTRNHPPQAGDRDDHPLMHPGVWIAFGDLNGADSWRLKAPVEHLEFVTPPRPAATGIDQQGAEEGAGFTVRNRYLGPDGKSPLSTEVTRYRFQPRPAGLLIVVEASLKGDQGPLSFGEQEEMGLGVRVATPIAVSSGQGGRLLDSAGRRNEKEIWGKIAAWCDYAGPTGSGWTGIAIFAARDNPRPSWWHVRDYGVFVANGFGPRSAPRPGAPPRLDVPKGETLRLTYGILIHESPGESDVDLANEYAAFEAILERETSPPQDPQPPARQ